ncbi:MAG: DUF357 domain-containing protein [Candidatus Aenigmatarchaeota archaeon]
MKKKQEKELFFYMNRELKRLKQVFSEVNLKKKVTKKASKEIFELAYSYFKDALYFYQKQEYVKTFELLNYCWGLLDALAIAKVLRVPPKMCGWFKTNF